MNATRALWDPLPSQRSRLVMWLGALTLLLSLMSPLIAIQTADAQERLQGDTQECPPGQIFDQNAGACIDDPAQLQDQEQQQQEPLQCPEGQIVDQTGTMCVQDPNLVQCPAGQVPDGQGGCMTDPNQPPPLDPTIIQIDKYDCPTHTDWTTVTDLTALSQGCAPNQMMVNMTVNGETKQITASGEWGPYQDTAGHNIAEQVPQGYNLPHWFCGTYVPNVSTPQMLPFGAAAQIAPTINPGESLYCQVYNHQPPTEQVGTVILHKLACPDGYTFGDPYMATIEQLQQECQQQVAGVTFDYEQNGQSVQQLTTDQSGIAQWDQAPTGPYTLRETLPFGYAYVVVHCSYHEANQGNFVGQSQPVQMSDAFSWGGTMDPGFVLDCYVFNIPSDQLQLNKYWCAPEVSDLQNPGEPDYQGACTAQAGAQISWRVALVSNDEEITSLQASGDVPGTASYNDLPQDQNIAILEQMPQDAGYGEPVVYCHEYLRGGDGQPTASYSHEPGVGVTWTPRAGYFLVCNFYNVPAQAGIQDADVYAAIQIEKYWCNEGYMPAEDAAQSDIMGSGQCQATGPETTLSLDGPGGPYDDMTVPGANGNVAMWELTEGGTYTVTETLPDGYQMLVYCHLSPLQVNGSNGTVGEEQWQVMNGNQIQWEAQEGYYWICAIFNLMVEDNGNSITVYKWQCGEDTETGQTQQYYQGEGQDQGPCESEHLNIPIRLIDGHPDSPRETTTQANGTEWDNVVLQNGSFQVAIDEPTGFGDPMVFCGTLDDEQQTPYAAPGGTWTITPASEPFTYQCNVYDIPTVGNSVTIYKWKCDPGTMHGQDQGYYQGQNGDPGPCEEVHGGVPIHLLDGRPDSPHDDVTSHNTPDWDGVVLANGSFQVQVDEPAGYGDPMVFCRTLDDEQSTMVDATGGMITITPASEPFDYQCDWYNIPYEGGYQLDLVKYTCTADVDRNLGLPDLGTNPNCAPDEGVSFTATFGMTSGSAYYTDASGELSWPDAAGGPWSLTEGPMTGYQQPKVFCGPPETTEAPEVPVTMDWTVSGMLDSTTPHIVCVWFNFEAPIENGHVTVYKIQCPPGTEITDFDLLDETCATPHNGVDFTLSGEGMESSASTSGGMVAWADLAQGTYTITEDLWPGYGAPLVWCGYVMQDGAPIDLVAQEFTSYPVTDASIQVELSNFPAHLVCYWYNFPSDPGEITIHKWTCPAGYDIDAWGADPKTDCTLATNGVTFTLNQPMGDDLQTDTGDSIDGAVYFGGLSPGAYTVTETVPAGTAYVFVLDCTGTDIPKVHQVPLSWGNKLDINVASGDQIVCHWYNVPRPETGWVTVYKYVCSTTTFVDKVYCVTYEKGQAFELFQVDGNVSKGTGITSAGGTYTWSDLEPGAYSIREDKGVPCKMTATHVDGKGNAWVNAGEGTIIKVYNCTTTPGKVPPGKVPTKYPNTGVPPQGELVAPRLQDAPEGTATPGTDEEAEAFYQVDCISGDVAATPPAGTPPPDTEVTMPPIEAEPTEAPPPAESEGTPTPPATPEVGEGECERGAIPQHLEIESVGIDADFEYLEIIDGLMEQPAGPELVAWYRDTARLGETNNVVVAGHLNWWNVPEGVFYRLQDLQEGDRVEVTGDDGRIYVYEVQWVRQESNLEPPGVDVIGPTDEQTLTLITCGGEWNADIAEYDERTVARAVQVDVIEAEASIGGASGMPLAA